MSIVFSRIGWWLLPLLMAVALLTTRIAPDLSNHVPTDVQRSDCNGGEAWTAVKLPQFMFGKRCERYLVRTSLRSEETLDQVLLIGGFSNDLRIWANGHLIRDFDARRGFDSTSQPALIELQPGVLRVGANEILLQLRSGSGIYSRSYLGRIYLGPTERLRPMFARAYLVGVQGAQLAVVFILAILLTLLPIAWTRRQDASYRWFLLAIVSSGVYIWNMGWPLRLPPSMLWHFLAHAGLTVALWAMLRYLMAMAPTTDRARPWVNGLMGLAVLLLTLKCFVPIPDLSGIADLGYRAALIAALLLLARLALLAWRRRQQPLGLWLCAAALLCLLLGVVDSVRVWRLSGAELAPYLLHWGILYLLALLLVGQVRRILIALGAAEQSQLTLGLALDERSRELQQEFALRQQAEQARMLAEERQRIMRDMHDGVGGQLVALMGQAERGLLDNAMLKQQVRRSLDDLRLMIDSLDDACADLSVALGMLRQRLQSSLAGLSLQVSWNTARLPDLAARPPDEVLQVMRIVQEAITNALKHARCKRLQISACWDDGRLEISVQDDGIGMRDAGSGRGLPNMRLRAQRIGGTIDIHDMQPGTRVTLRLAQSLAEGGSISQPQSLNIAARGEADSAGPASAH